jgi:type IX secretion system PorP/SprF family membrane protein
MKKILAIGIVVLSMVVNLSAQDKHFSQFWASPLQLNPAFTGKFDGQLRIAGNYRNQWPEINQAFITHAASADFGVMKNRINEIDNWGFGIAGYSDRSASGVLQATNIAASTAYHKGLDEDGNHQIGVGLQVEYLEKRLNTGSDKLQFGDMLRPNGWTGISTDVLANRSLKVQVVDVNAGVLYNGSTNENNNFYAGVSVYHVTRQKESFIGANYLSNPRLTSYLGGYFAINERTTVYGSALHSSQSKASETLLGGAVGFTPNPEALKPSTVFGGVWARIGDAVIPYVGLEFGDYRLGFSYDVNTSSLRTASNTRGGFELSLIYISKPNTEKGIPCPKF